MFLISNKKLSKLAFTIAEILIVMGIIGIIAELTLPSLVHDLNEQQEVASLRKSYSTLAQAYQSIIAEYGTIENALSNLSSDADHSGFADVFIKKMRIRKLCGLSSDTNANAGCFPNAYYKQLNGAPIASMFYNYSTCSNCFYTLIANDGVSYAFRLGSKTCTANANAAGNCGGIHVDVNGPNKGPAQMGRDLFIFYVNKNGLLPRGAFPDGNSCGDCTTCGGQCATKVITEGAMNY